MIGIEPELNRYDADQVIAARKAEERAERVEAERLQALTDEGALVEVMAEMGQNIQALIYIGRMVKENKDGAAGASFVALLKDELDNYAERMVE